MFSEQLLLRSRLFALEGDKAGNDERGEAARTDNEWLFAVSCVGSWGRGEGGLPHIFVCQRHSLQY